MTLKFSAAAFPLPICWLRPNLRHMSVEELESNVARLSAEELARFSRWFEEFRDEEERARRRKAVEDVDAFRVKMSRKYGVQPSSVDLIREVRDNPRG
jgi:hypothetical protein